MSNYRSQPLTTPSGLKLKNRLVVPPMASQTATESGLVSDVTIKHYQRLANAGAGLVMVEYSFVDLSGRSEPSQMGAHSDECIPGLTQLAKALHDSGVSTGLQLTHCGGKGSKALCSDFMCPSGLPVPAYDRELETARAMTQEEIGLWRSSFLNAAIRADKAGFDAVEIHAAHGYGINQWLSPITNHRKDAYGGCLKNRARLLLEIVADIRVKCPNLMIMVRVPGQDLYPNGLSTGDMREIIDLLTTEGVSIIDVSSGIGGWNRPKARRGEGYLIDEAKQHKRTTTVPVIGVGGIESVDYIEKILHQQDVDLVAIGRAILKDPIAFQQRVFGDSVNKSE